jgi:hypothetical protein
VQTKLQVLVFGQSQLLSRLTQILRASARLDVVEAASPGSHPPDVILVDAAQVTPEQFNSLLQPASSSHSTLISIDPSTYQLTVLSSPGSREPLEEVAAMLELLSVSLSPLSTKAGSSG